jgi:transcriptional regulator with XRE-family HTH domain
MSLSADQIKKRTERIQELKTRGLNIAQIASVTGYSRKYVSRTLSGRETIGKAKQEWTGILARTLGFSSAEVDALSKRTGRFTGSSRLPDVDGYYVYFLIGSGDILLYVGKSTNIYARLGQHMSDPVKRVQVHHVEFFRCESEDHMNRVERILIGTTGPVWNIVHKNIVHNS